MFRKDRYLSLPALVLTPVLCAFTPINGPRLARQVSKEARTQRDPSLDESARRHALDILLDRNSASWEGVKAALRREGLADAQFWPVAVVGARPATLVTQLLEATASQGADRGATHVGFGSADHQGTYALVALFVRRLVRISPLPLRPAPRGLLVRGRTDVGERLEALWMGPCRDIDCTGGVRQLTLQSGRAGWALPVPSMKTSTDGGETWTLELMVDTERGPEPAVLWQFGTAGPARPLSGPPSQWVADFRDRHELAPLRPHRALARAADRHATRVCRQRVAAHILADGIDPQHRAMDAGYSGRVTENVAVAPTAAAAHRDLLRSPSHRRNVLDPTAVHYGMAVATAPATPGARPIQCWVELFGHPHR